MIEYYEVKSNVNLPSLGCTLTRGSRVEIANGTLTALGRSVPVGPDFQILLRHGILVRLTAAQAARPETPEMPRTRPLHERAVMPVRAEESITVEMQRRIAARNSAAQDRRIVDYDNGTDRSEAAERTIRGMRVEQRTELPVHREQAEAAAPAVRLAPKHSANAGTKAARLAAVAEAEAKAAATKEAERAEKKAASKPAEASASAAPAPAAPRAAAMKKPAEPPQTRTESENAAPPANAAAPAVAPANAPETPKAAKPANGKETKAKAAPKAKPAAGKPAQAEVKASAKADAKGKTAKENPKTAKEK